MFLSHFSGSGLKQILKLSIREAYRWYIEAEKLHNKLKTTPEKVD